MRLMYVAAFAVGAYPSSERTYKPFNPILGETFEFESPSYYYVAEQARRPGGLGSLRTGISGFGTNCLQRGWIRRSAGAVAKPSYLKCSGSGSASFLSSKATGAASYNPTGSSLITCPPSPNLSYNTNTPLHLRRCPTTRPWAPATPRAPGGCTTSPRHRGRNFSGTTSTCFPSGAHASKSETRRASLGF